MLLTSQKISEQNLHGGGEWDEAGRHLELGPSVRRNFDRRAEEAGSDIAKEGSRMKQAGTWN